jgi:hypothetical protein
MEGLGAHVQGPRQSRAHNRQSMLVRAVAQVAVRTASRWAGGSPGDVELIGEHWKK